MKKLKGILVLVLLLALLASPVAVLASDVSGAKFYGLIQVTNNGTAITNEVTTCNISTTNLINGGYLNSSANNCAIQSSAGADLPFMPSVNASFPWCLWVPAMGADSIKTDILYTANSTGGKIRYFPDTGGMTTLDDPQMELGDNFTITQSGWINTDNGSDKYLAHKPGAFGVYVSANVSGNITASLMASGANTTTTLYPDGAGDYTNIASVTGAATHWEAVDDPSASPDDGTTLVSTNNVAYEKDAYNLEPLGLEGVAGVASVKVYFRARESAGVGKCKPYLRLGANETTGTEIDITTDFVTYSEVLARPGGGSWEVNDINDLQVAIGIKNSAATTQVTQVYVVVTFQYSIPSTPAVTATGVSSGERTITTSGNSAFLGLGVDIGDNTTFPSVTGNLVLNAPMWSTFLTGSPFGSVDANAYTCTVTGAVWTSDGRLFDGNDHIDTGQTFQATFRDSFTSLHWVTLDDGQPAASEYIFGSINASGEDRLSLEVLSTGVLRMRYKSNNEEVFGTTSGAIFSDGQETPHLIGVVIDKSVGTHGQIYLYLDGVVQTLAGDGDLDPLTIVMGDFTTVSTLFLGAQNNNGVPVSYVNGVIGDAWIYSQALDSNENLEIYDATKWKYIGSHTADDFDYVYSGVSVPNNDNDWAFLQNNVMPYMEYHTVSINGTQVQYIGWEYDTTFYDTSGFDNDASPSFRGTPSDPDVSAELISFLPVAEAKAPAYALEEEVDFIEEVPVIVSEFGVTPPAGTFPLAGVIVAVANATDTPPQLPLVIIAFFVIIALSLAISSIMRKYGSGTILVKVIVIAAIMGVFVGIGNFGVDFWMIFVFLTIGIALSMASRHVSWA